MTGMQVPLRFLSLTFHGMNPRHHQLSYYIINGITVYRVLMAPVLTVLLFTAHINWFRWLLVISFFTDSIDGFLARKFKVTSKFGSKLDSIGDDLTVFAAFIGLVVVHTDFVKAHWLPLATLFLLFLSEMAYAFSRYGKPTGFHTYFAKAAAILQGVFLILAFFITPPMSWLFYLTVSVTALQLIEELVLIRLLPQWTANVRGIWWVLRRLKRGQYPGNG